MSLLNWPGADLGVPPEQNSMTLNFKLGSGSLILFRSGTLILGSWSLILGPRP